jgi:nucleotide-binding universal stress UspA family protein
MRRILVAIDGSPDAKKALSHASGLATKFETEFETELLILHVASHDAVSEQEAALLKAEYAGELIRDAKQAGPGAAGADESWPVQIRAPQGETAALSRRLLGERLLADAERTARESGGKHVRTILAEGDPAREILAAATAEGVDAIVIGSRGLGKLSALLLGSISHKVSNQAHCTVIIVR